MSTTFRSRNARLCMYSRVSGIGHWRSHIFARTASVAANAAARSLSPSGSAINMAAPGKSFSPLRTIASNTGCVSAGELLISLRISAVAACCCSASSRSRASCATVVSLAATVRRRAVFGALRLDAFMRRAFAVLRPLRRFIPYAPAGHGTHQTCRQKGLPAGLPPTRQSA